MNEHIQERELLRLVKSGEEPIERLRTFLEEPVSAEVRKCMMQWHLDSDDHSLFMRMHGVAMEPLRRVVELYMSKPEYADAEDGHFAAYYRWWARQAMREYIEGLQRA